MGDGGEEPLDRGDSIAELPLEVGGLPLPPGLWIGSEVNDCQRESCLKIGTTLRGVFIVLLALSARPRWVKADTLRLRGVTSDEELLELLDNPAAVGEYSPLLGNMISILFISLGVSW